MIDMKRWIFLLLVGFLGTQNIKAQGDVIMEITESGDTIYSQSAENYKKPYSLAMYPIHDAGWYGWDLHEGLNINVGLSAFAEFGKYARRGVGFGQNLSALYVKPVSDKLSLTIGGYLNNVNWQNESYRSAGITAQLGYRFNEHWEAYIYGQKALLHNNPPLSGYYGYHGMYGMYPMDMMYYNGYMGNVDRIGAAVRYNVNPSFSIQVNVERNWIPRHEFGVPDNLHSPPSPSLPNSDNPSHRR